MNGDAESGWFTPEQAVLAVAALVLSAGELIAVSGCILTKVHPSSQCAGTYCWVHHPSEHHMITWPVGWRSDKGTAERVCVHGVGHPDPDDVAFHARHGRDVTVHSCDGCCSRPDVPYSQLMEDFVTPADIAREFGITQRSVRAYLRARYGTLAPPETRWRLDTTCAADVRAHFRNS